MKNGHTIKKILGILLCWPLLGYATTPSSNTFSAGLQSILTAHPPHIGIMVTRLKTGTVLFHKNAKLFFTPASTQKLFPTIAALAYLGPDFRFQTQLRTNGTIKNHDLKGDLFIQFSGDPELTDHDLNQLLGKLKTQGIQKISGHIYIDNAEYGSIPYGPGWMWDDLSYGYAAPLNAVIINHNRFILHLTPSQTSNKPPALVPDLPQGIAVFINHISTTPKRQKKCPITVYSDSHNQYTLSGCISRAAGKQRRSLEIRDPIAYAKGLIQQSLQQHHIQFSNRITKRQTPRTATRLAQHASPPLKQIVFTLLKNSDNLATDSLLKTLGERYYQKPGTWQNGLEAMKAILQKEAGIDFEGGLITDGAGLSRYNLISPAQFSTLLDYAYHNESIRRTLLKALPVAGKDGTLIDRMLNARNNHLIRAKTGSMAGVASLAGYIKNKSLGDLSFVIMINGLSKKEKSKVPLEDQLSNYLANYSGQTHE